MMMQKEHKINTGECPVCDGTGRMPTPDNLRRYGEQNGWYGYSKDDDRMTCDNCGGQTMYGKATGRVNLRPDGTPCHHVYTGREAGRCYSIYTCIHCTYSYDVDSSD